MHLTSTSDDVSEKVPVESNCMPKSVTKHYHLSSYSAVQYFSEAFFFFLAANFTVNTLLGGKETKLFAITASYRTLSTEENCFGQRCILRKSYKSFLNCKIKCSLSFSVKQKGLNTEKSSRKIVRFISKVWGLDKNLRMQYENKVLIHYEELTPSKSCHCVK